MVANLGRIMVEAQAELRKRDAEPVAIIFARPQYRGLFGPRIRGRYWYDRLRASDVSLDSGGKPNTPGYGWSASDKPLFRRADDKLLVELAELDEREEAIRRERQRITKEAFGRLPLLWD